MSTRALKRKRLKQLHMKEDDGEFKNKPPKKKSKKCAVQKQFHMKDKEDDNSDSEFKNKPLKKKPKKFTAKDARIRQLLEANEEEDKNIKRLESLLKIDKKKKKKLPSVFKEDGLDFILEAIEGKNSGFILSDDSCDFEEDIAALKGKTNQNSEKQKPQPKKRTLTQLLNETEGLEEKETEPEDTDNESAFDEDELDEEPSDSEGSIGSEEELDESKEQEPDELQNEEEEKPKVWEDIYGRLRDESGNVINGSKTASNVYIPPKLRKQNGNESSENEERTRIKRNLKGLINRLSESNLQSICNQIEDMYRKHSRNDMNETLFGLMSELLFSASLTPHRLVMEQAMLVSLLHANIGSEVGAFFLQSIVEKIGTLLKDAGNYGDGKEFNNILLFLSHLYIFKMTHSTLMFDILNILVQSFCNKDIELIQLLLKNIGFGLRKDDPLKLKELVFSIKDKAASFNTEDNDSRVKFMLETLTAIRNNNIYKVPDYDPSIIEHSKKFLRGLIRKGCSLQELSISYEDLLKAKEKGRWWIVGSAWVEPEEAKKTSDQQPEKPKNLYSDKILELARKQHMNTDTRKSVFCILMTAEDFMDAFEKLLKLNLKNQQEREIINVILHCVIQEKTFNPYYAHLLDKFCTYARKHQICLQFSLWDKFKEVSGMKSYKLNNIARLLSHLFISGALPISVLKVIHFSDMDKPMVRFFRQILLAVLLHESEDVVSRVFTRISRAENLKLLRESLKLFMHHFILKNQSKLEPEEAAKLKERVKLAENSMKPPTRLF